MSVRSRSQPDSSTEVEAGPAGAMLHGWRVLDFTDDRGDVGPYLLADLGATVTKIEPAGGCPSRSIGTGERHFTAYNANKSSIELSGDHEADRLLVGELLTGADLVFDSGPPGRLAELGFDRSSMRAANDRIVYVLLTPFGLDGPRADQAATEFTIAALGGSARLQGTPERAPVQMSVPQVWRHAGAEAASASLIAHRRMLGTGEAQFVDVSAQSVMTWTMLNAMEAFDIQGRDFERTGSELHLSINVQLRLEATDGYVVGVPTGRELQFLLPWLLEDGIVDDGWSAVDWTTFDHHVISGHDMPYTLTEVAEAVYELCRRYPKWELFRRGLDYGATLAPLNDLADLLGFDHLEARRFWVSASTEGAGVGPVRYPGAFYRENGRRRAVVRGTRPVTEIHQSSAQPPSRRDASVSQGTGDLPLSGLKVVDFSWIGVGPITAKVLADHGATVVRVESEGRIDGLRLQVPFKDAEPGINRSQFFATFNTSKLGLGLNLKSQAGVDTARRLIEWADVVIESFTPGTMDRLGLGYDQMSPGNPSLIMVSTSLLATGSPASSMAGYGYHAAAIAGFQNLVGWPDLPPDGPWLAYTDTIGPRFISSSILAALSRRDATGEGCHIEAAQLEIALQLLAPELATFQATQEPLTRLGNRDPVIAPQGAYPTAGDDQWLALSITDDRAWRRLVELLGRPEWALDPALGSVEGRRAAHDDIDHHLAVWTATQDGPTLEKSLAEEGIAAGVMQSSRQLAQDRQYRHRRFYRLLDHEEMGQVPYAGHQYNIDGYDHGPRHAAPCLGQHTYEVLTELLGLDEDEIASLAADGGLD